MSEVNQQLLLVASELDKFQRRYDEATYQNGRMPGNELYGPMLMEIVVRARAAIAAAEQAQQSKTVTLEQLAANLKAGEGDCVISAAMDQACADMERGRRMREQAQPVLFDDEGWKSGGELWRSGIANPLAKQQAEPVALSLPFFAYDEEVGFERFATEAEAKKFVQDGIDECRSNMLQGEAWPSEIENLCWGVVLGGTKEIKLGDADDGSGDYYSDYVLTDAAKPPAQQQAEPVARDDLAEAMRNIVRLGDEHFEYGGSMVLRTANNCIVDMQEIANGALLAAAQPPAVACNHRIADARNPIVASGYICVDCGALFNAADHTHPPAVAVPDGWQRELLDWVSACQSAYHIDNTPGHRFGGLGSNLEDNRSQLVEYVADLLAAAQKGSK